jgi:hypothetical protein
MTSEYTDYDKYNNSVYIGNGIFISKDPILDGFRDELAIAYRKEQANEQRGTYESYVKLMEETCYHFDLLITRASRDEKEKKLLEPHFDKLKKLCDERLDEIERIEKMKCGAYVYFIELLKINKLDLLKTIHIEPYIYESFEGLIERTHKRLLEEEEKKNKK